MSTVDVVVVAGGRPANFCDLGGGGNAEGVVDALEVITRDEQVQVDLLQHLRRDHALRRGRARDPRGARADRRSSVPIVVRLDGTNAEEGRRILAEAAPPNLHVEPTMLDAARARRGAGGMTTSGTSGREAYRDSGDARAGDDLDLVVEWCEPARGRALDVATGGGHVARRLREAGAEVVTLDPSPGMQADVSRPAEDLPFADGELRRRRHAASPRTTSPTSRKAVARDGARRATRVVRRRRHALRGRGGRGGREAARPDARAHYGGRVARASSTTPGSRSRRSHSSRSGIDARAVARAHRVRRRRRGSGCASCSATAIRDGRPRADRDRAQGEEVAEVVAILVDSDTRLVVQGLTGRRAASTACATATTARTSSRASRRARAARTSRASRFSTRSPTPSPRRGANTSLIFVPARFAADAIYEAVDAGIATVICITEHVPAHDMLRVYTYLRARRA